MIAIGYSVITWPAWRSSGVRCASATAILSRASVSLWVPEGRGRARQHAAEDTVNRETMTLEQARNEFGLKTHTLLNSQWARDNWYEGDEKELLVVH